MIRKCGVLLNIWATERVVGRDECLPAALVTFNSSETQGLKMQIATEQALLDGRAAFDTQISLKKKVGQRSGYILAVNLEHLPLSSVYRNLE